MLRYLRFEVYFQCTQFQEILFSYGESRSAEEPPELAAPLYLGVQYDATAYYLIQSYPQ